MNDNDASECSSKKGTTKNKKKKEVKWDDCNT